MDHFGDGRDVGAYDPHVFFGCGERHDEVEMFPPLVDVRPLNGVLNREPRIRHAVEPRVLDLDVGGKPEPFAIDVSRAAGACGAEEKFGFACASSISPLTCSSRMSRRLFGRDLKL